MATANSRMVSVSGIAIAVIEFMVVILIKAFPNKVISKCPAIRLAVSRTHNVIGRIRFLDNSIITIKLIRAIGVP